MLPIGSGLNSSFAYPLPDTVAPEPDALLDPAFIVKDAPNDGVGVGVGVAVGGMGVAVGAGVAVGGMGVAVGVGVLVAVGAGVAVGVAVGA